MLLGTSATKLLVWSTSSPTKSAELIQKIERPVLSEGLTCTIRSAKFGRQGTSSNIYTVVNSQPTIRLSRSRSRRYGSSGGDTKKAFVSLWDSTTWKLVNTKTISQKPVTAFDISPDGELLAFGSSDLSVGILDARTLQPLLAILHAHDFPVTCLRFNPASNLLVSASADNTVRVITVDRRASERSRVSFTAVLLTILFLFLALGLQMAVGKDIKRLALEHLHL